ncbi:MAG: endonuclease V [Candidatus Pacearchaeota archaeon]|jgi:deoxyribonuclease V|nr:endonuclease V [Candidatus Pacearchaeota archaeon]HJO15136.1 endonuclease V [Candidatus Pacearchaeota archaeon]|tara:strand:- start:731 stop:1423 length:693 start_codon:yes stop_codon:yes gene_type:complete
MGENLLDTRKDELSKRYGIDFDKLEKEQIKLAKDLTIKDKIDFSLVDRFGAVENIFIKNKILSCFIVVDKDFEIIDQAYAFERIPFPYFPGFRGYRELPAMIKALERLNEKPDIVFISAQGIIHPRLGLASHFGLVTNIPSVGVSSSLIECEASNEDASEIIKDNEVVGKVLISKKESNPLYIGPGNNITVNSSYDISKKLIRLPHKRPEPIHIAAKYARNVKKELVIED